MSKDRVYLSSPHMSDEGYEREYVKEAFDTNWVSPAGANLGAFEKSVCDLTGAKAAVALSSGTAAIHLALKVAGVKDGDIVFCQSLTFSGSANPIAYVNAKPVFIDSDYETWNMCPKALEEAFDKYPQVKAVIAVNLYGISANYDMIKKLCNDKGVALIEDAAESLGTKYKNQYTGTFGDYGIFSFNGNKIITSSGGGMLVCNTDDAEEKINKAAFYATQAKEPAKYYQHEEIGYNYRMSNIVAGIGRGQMKVLKDRVAKKQYIFDYYKKHLGDLKGIEFMPADNDCNSWLSCITLADNLDIKPIDIIEALEKENIEARHVWKPMHMQPVFSDCDYIGSKVAEDLFNRGVCLPSDSKMTDEQLERTCEVIKGIWK